MLNKVEFEELQERIGGFAQELQDMILDHLLEVENEQEVRVEDWAPPLALHVSSKVRRKVAPKYFASTLFVVDIEKFRPWTYQLADWHVENIRQVGLDDRSNFPHEKWHCRDLDRCHMINSWILADYIRSLRGMLSKLGGNVIRAADVQMKLKYRGFDENQHWSEPQHMDMLPETREVCELSRVYS